MMKFIEKPNLPKGKVTTVICGTEDEKILSYFERNGISVIRNAPNGYIDPSVSTHADMAAIHIGGKQIIIDKNQFLLADKLRKLGATVIENEGDIEGEYPCDIGLNFTFIGKNVFGKFSHADRALLRETEGFEKLDVRQGYCKCSVLVVDEKALITDDEGIHRKALEKGIDSLLVSKGDVSLDGHPYGFIGGASGKITEDTVIFFGDVENHRDFEKIRAFLSSHGCFYECTDKEALRDIGGMIPLCEEM